MSSSLHGPNTSSSYQSINLNDDDESDIMNELNEVTEMMASSNTKKKKIIDSDDEYNALIKDDDSDDDNNEIKKINWNKKHISKIVIGAGAGSFLEFYSFGLVAYFQNEIQSAYFPPTLAGFDSLLESFTLYGIAFAVRPFGGMLFGYIADKYGRVYSLRLSLILMIIPTMLFGLLPNYNSIGMIATILVFLCRVIQGLCVGGEISTALVYIVEESPSHLKATLIGLLFAFSCGSYLALIVYALYNESVIIESESTAEWTWRIAFVSSVFIGIFGYYMRKMMPISYEFDNINKNNAILSNPLKTIFDEFRIEFGILFLTYLGPPIIWYTIGVWLPAYLESTLTNSLDGFAYDVQLISGALSIIFCALTGWIADHYYYGDYSKYAKITLLLTLIGILICFTFISLSKNIIFISFLQIILSFATFGGTAVVIWSAVWIPDARIRSTLTGTTYNLGMALFVSTLFDVQTYLANLDLNFGGMYAGLYVVIICSLSYFAILYANNKHSWKNYHFYGSINPHNIDNENNSDENDISDHEIDIQNPYSVI